MKNLLVSLTAFLACSAGVTRPCDYGCPTVGQALRVNSAVTYGPPQLVRETVRVTAVEVPATVTRSERVVEREVIPADPCPTVTYSPGVILAPSFTVYQSHSYGVQRSFDPGYSFHSQRNFFPSRDVYHAPAPAAERTVTRRGLFGRVIQRTVRIPR